MPGSLLALPRREEQTMFQSGQLVLCVDATPRPGVVSPVVKGHVYTVAGLHFGSSRKPGLVLEEVRAPATYRCFRQDRFRHCRPEAIASLRKAVREVMRPREIET